MRPNWTNKEDACCCCATLGPTPPTDGDGLKSRPGDLKVWQPTANDPPQWICEDCHEQLTKDARRAA